MYALPLRRLSAMVFGAMTIVIDGFLSELEPMFRLLLKASS